MVVGATCETEVVKCASRSDACIIALGGRERDAPAAKWMLLPLVDGPAVERFPNDSVTLLTWDGPGVLIG